MVGICSWPAIWANRMLVLFNMEATFPRETTLKSRVPLIFVWSKDQNAPLLLGQFNFFENFDVCFYRSKNYFEVQPNDSH